MSLEALRKATSLDGHNAKAYFIMGKIYSEQGNSSEARKLLVRSARLGDGEAQQVLQHQGVTW